ncbi:hypothetical protein [Bacteroides caecigallinarum]|uniref:hypothetical protein n=1 Tax=Bacteroides caecigallinarum TaxID=1411144 RepID=UPI001F440308|nr:hypothetical protein [Bacteroides caecigallinarum]MCF2551030.1 hypothetical protein [Bacteroides caecigallinarum]
MRKIVMFLLAFCLVAPVVDAQNKALEKELKKEYKDRKKELKKGGWEIFGTSRSADVTLLKHFDKLNTLGDDAKEVVGIASRFKSKNVGKQMAVNNACLTYAQAAGSYVKGRVMSDMAGDGVDTEGEMDNFYAAYERLVEKEIRGEMEESYSIIRDNGDGTFELQTYFIVNESAASKARIRAMEEAAKESAAAQKYANQISEFVQEGFEAE